MSHAFGFLPVAFASPACHSRKRATVKLLDFACVDPSDAIVPLSLWMKQKRCYYTCFNHIGIIASYSFATLAFFAPAAKTNCGFGLIFNFYKVCDYASVFYNEWTILYPCFLARLVGIGIHKIVQTTGTSKQLVK